MWSLVKGDRASMRVLRPITVRFRVVAMAMQRLAVEPIVRAAGGGRDDVVELDQVAFAKGQATARTAPSLAFQGAGYGRAREGVVL